MVNKQTPVVLAVGGHDPTGGAGLSADIQTLTALGCHPVTVVTALTVQDLQTVQTFEGVDRDLLQRQCETILRSFPVNAIKLGMLGNGDVAETLAPLLAKVSLPLVVDPVLSSGDGSALARPTLSKALREKIIPLASVMTPNTAEALALTGAAEVDEAAHDLLVSGCGAVLITGTDTSRGPDVVHRLYVEDTAPQTFSYPRLPGNYHGSGCTLASAISAYLARGVALQQSVDDALRFTYNALRDALHFSTGQAVPKR